MGFAGHRTHPARQNLRPVKLNINNQDWFMQYSPYGYYNEHCIVFNKQHIPMTINAQVFNYLAAHGEMTELDVQKLLDVKKTRAFNIIKGLREMRLVETVGKGADKKIVLVK